MNLTGSKALTVVVCVENAVKNIKMSVMKKKQKIQVVGIADGVRNVVISGPENVDTECDDYIFFVFEEYD